MPNFHFLQQAGYFDAAVDSKPLLHLWSLGVEEQFYLGWPLLLVVLVRRLDPSALRISILVVALVSLALYGVISSHSASAAFYLPFTRFWQLLAGAMLAAAPHATQALRASPGWCHMLSVAGVALMLGAILGSAGGAANAVPVLVTTAGAAAFIAAGTHATLNATLFSWRPVVYIGLISYSLYLWHWPLLSFLRILHLEDVMLDRALRVAAVGFWCSRRSPSFTWSKCLCAVATIWGGWESSCAPGSSSRPPQARCWWQRGDFRVARHSRPIHLPGR